MQSKNEAGLSRILELLLDNELALLSSIAREREVIGEETRRIRSLKAGNRNARMESNGFDPSQMAEADENWELWVEKKLRENIAELAKTNAAFEEQKLRCLNTFGRKSAFEKLVIQL